MGIEHTAMKLNSLFFLLALLTSLFACSDETDCGIADAITNVQSVIIHNKSYFIILRTSGFQDKISYYDLYERVPIFDICGRANVKPIASVEIEEPENLSKLIIKNQTLQIIYSKNNAPITDISKILVEVQ